MLIFVIPFLGTMVLMAEGTGISSAYVIFMVQNLCFFCFLVTPVSI